MSMRSLETAICAELREVSGIKKLRVKDMFEWSTGDIEAREGETLFFLPVLRVSAIISSALVPVPKVAKKAVKK